MYIYTFFFLLSLIQYWYFLTNNKRKHILLSLLFFGLSILSKPAAIVLPFVLFFAGLLVWSELEKKFIVETTVPGYFNCIRLYHRKYPIQDGDSRA